MEEKLNFTQQLQKPIAMMTGEELCFLITDKAITQIGRKIVVDADLALSLAKEAGGIHIKE